MERILTESKESAFISYGHVTCMTLVTRPYPKLITSVYKYKDKVP
jgi:hypothetical protein